MLNIFIQDARPHRGHGLTAMFRHSGALGLFLLAILDSSPLPTFGGTDILTAILAASHRNPWYEYAAVATAGSVIGAYLTFRIARQAGLAYLHSRFGNLKLDSVLDFFHRRGTSALAVSTAVPLPFPTSVFFAAAGASNYNLGKFLTVVTICRGTRYAVIAIIASDYGRQFIHALRHPGRYWEWLVWFVAILFSLILAEIALSRRWARSRERPSRLSAGKRGIAMWADFMK